MRQPRFHVGCGGDVLVQRVATSSLPTITCQRCGIRIQDSLELSKVESGFVRRSFDKRIERSRLDAV